VLNPGSNTFWSNRNTLPTAQPCPDCPGLDGPHVAVDGTTLALGNETNTPQSRILRRNIFDDNMSVQKGAHHMKPAASGNMIMAPLHTRGVMDINKMLSELRSDRPSDLRA
jgi:hypothetical protein